MLNYLKKRQQKILNEVSNFYTPTGIQVYFKDQMINDKLGVEETVADFEQLIPSHLLSEIEMIIFGHFDEFEEKQINAFYRDGALNISNSVNDEEELLEIMIHETSHSVEEAYGQSIYLDQRIKEEFLRKRMHLHDLLWKMGFKLPKSLFEDPEYNKEFDLFLFEKVGYDQLSEAMMGLYITPYAATSLREYFATGFAEYFTRPNDHSFLKRVSPQLYEKLELLKDEERLDNSY